MRKLGSSKGGLGRDKRGVVYVEFLLVFPPLFLLFLVILQSAILRSTDIGVRHAASGAVRSAIVVLPDDPYFYGGNGENRIDMSASCTEGFFGKFKLVLSKLKIAAFELPKDGKCPGGPRLEAIRFSAIMRMLPFSPNPQSILPKSLGPVASGLGKVGWIAGAAAYSYGATAVTFPDDKDPKKQRANLEWADGKPVTVRVSYLAHCGIPIARFFMCDSGHSLATGIDFDHFKRDGFLGSAEVRKRLGNQGSTLTSMNSSVGSWPIFAALLSSGERFMVLSADATLPLNSAPYKYKSKDP